MCITNHHDEITDVVEKPDDPPSSLVMTGFYTFTPAIFHSCKLVQPSNCGKYEISEAIDRLILSDRTIGAIPLDGWRLDLGYPEVRDKVEERLHEEVPLGEES